MDITLFGFSLISIILFNNWRLLLLQMDAYELNNFLQSQWALFPILLHCKQESRFWSFSLYVNVVGDTTLCLVSLQIGLLFTGLRVKDDPFCLFGIYKKSTNSVAKKKK